MEERLAVLRRGDYLEKLGRNGGVKVRFFKLSDDETNLEYIGRSGLVEIPLTRVKHFLAGRQSEQFIAFDKKARIPDADLRALASVSFSVLYDKAGKGPMSTGLRTLDIMCQGNAEQHLPAHEQMEIWFKGLIDAVRFCDRLLLRCSEGCVETYQL